MFRINELKGEPQNCVLRGVSTSKPPVKAIGHFQDETLLKTSVGSSNPTSKGNLGDSQGNPTERYFWSHFGRVMTERRTELRFPYVNLMEPTFNEIIETEAKTRRMLYEL